MANTLPIFQSSPRTVCSILDDSDGTSLVPIFAADATNGSLIDNISVTSTDTANVILTLTVNDGTTACNIGEMTVPAGAGTDGETLAFNLLNGLNQPFLQSGGGLPLGASATLSVNAQAGMTAATQLDVVCYGGDY